MPRIEKASAVGKIQREDTNPRRPSPRSFKPGRRPRTITNGANKAMGPKMSCSLVGNHRMIRMPVNPAASPAKSRRELGARGTVKGYAAGLVVAKERAPQKTVRIPENKIGCKNLVVAELKRLVSGHAFRNAKARANDRL